MIAASASPVGEDAGFFERLLSSAESLVKVRPIGDVEGDSVPANGRAHGSRAFKAGELAKAIAEFETLPEAAEGGGTALRRQDPGAARRPSNWSTKALAGAMKSA